MEEESWRTHGGGMMEKQWKRNNGGDIKEEESWSRNKLEGITKENS